MSFAHETHDTCKCSDGAMDGAPRTAGELAVALSGVQAPEAGSLEQATLLGALLDARGLGPVTYGVDEGATDAATDIARRRYLVKAGDGEWLTVDEEKKAAKAKAAQAAKAAQKQAAAEAQQALEAKQRARARAASQEKLRQNFGAKSYTQQGQDWGKLFQRYDRDNSGFLDFDEFRRAVRRDAKLAPKELSDVSLRELFGWADESGGVSFLRGVLGDVVLESFETVCGWFGSC